MKQIYYVIQTLLRGRGSNIIKVISLGLGLTMSILLFSRVAYEQSFDTCFKDYDNLYQVWSVFTTNGERHEPQEQNSGPVAGAILENFPKEVEAACSVGRWPASKPLYNGNVRFNDLKVVADSLFFRTMGIGVLSGNPERDLVQPDVIFLSERFAKKIFGDESPIGKQLSYDHQLTLTVRGTYATIPENATMHPEGVISMPTAWSRNWGNYSWSGGDSWTEYIRFRPGADCSVVNKRIDAMIEKYRPAEDKKTFGYTAFVQPIRDTYRDYEDVRRMTGIMSILGFAILFIATLNYVLISISSLAHRAKAVGVHKCSGASGGTVFSMFLLETGIIIALALVLMGLILLNFQEFIEDTTAAKLSVLFAPDRIWVPLVVVLVLFIVGGILPDRLFARIPVSQVFRRYTEGKKGWKRPLLFVQFAGVAFICGLMYVVMMQYYYILNKDLGYITGKSLFEVYQKLSGEMSSMRSNIAKGDRLFVNGLMAMEPNKVWAPNANSTIRLTYGNVKSYKPRDAVFYDYYTTLTGVMEKEGPKGGEFEVPQNLKDLYYAKNFGRYGADNISVNFITNNDITGGNSGSPVINGNGELIGTAFDGNSEAMSGDIDFEENLQRCINLDARYMLFIVDKIANAQNLINEMTIVF